jgi:hypothetical protein
MVLKLDLSKKKLFIPPHIQSFHFLHHKNVVPCADIYHVDGLHFLSTISQNLHFGTIEFMPSSMHHASILAGIQQQVINIYSNCGFTATWIFTDHAFEQLCTALASSDINLSVTATNDEQVPEIECFIHVIKDHHNFSHLPTSKHHENTSSPAYCSNTKFNYPTKWCF